MIPPQDWEMRMQVTEIKERDEMLPADPGNLFRAY
jgi:hypothetical protein